MSQRPMVQRQSISEQVLYGTKQVAEILGIPEWRVKNFSEGEAYGLPPSQRVGSGRGSRRLYNLNDVLRLAVASELVNCGFTPETVGRAVREIPESMLTMWPEVLQEPASKIKSAKELSEHFPLLVLAEGDWRVKKVHEVKKLLKETFEYVGEERGLFILNFPSLLAGVHRQIKRFAEKENRVERRR